MKAKTICLYASIKQLQPDVQKHSKTTHITAY